MEAEEEWEGETTEILNNSRAKFFRTLLLLFTAELTSSEKNGRMLLSPSPNALLQINVYTAFSAEHNPTERRANGG